MAEEKQDARDRSAARGVIGIVSFGIFLGLIVIGFLVWPGPQIRERSRAADAASKAEAAAARQRQETEAELQRAAERRAGYEAIVKAKDEDLLGVIQECKESIVSYIAQKGRNEYYFFPYYIASDIDALIKASMSMGAKLGRPSHLFDKPSNIQEEYNIKRLNNAELSRIPDIEFVVEDRYGVVLYSCNLVGIKTDHVFDRRIAYF